jgi:AraC-like DNA-binding protein
MEARGFSPEAVLEGTGLRVTDLKNPGHLVDFTQYQTVVANMFRLTGNQGIGLEVGSECELTDFGIVGYGMMSAPTAREALHLWLRYSNTLVGMLVAMRLEEHAGGAWSLTLSEIRPMGFLYNFAVEELLLIVVRTGSALVKKSVRPSLIELSYPAPAHHERYAELFGCKPTFNCRRTRIRFEEPSLNTPLKGGDEEFNAICLQHCNQMLKQIATHTPLVSRIRSLLLSRVGGIPSFDDLADELGMSARTLRRHLHDEGTSYKQLINEFRMELAKEYVATSRLQAKEVAHLLGFKDTNAFRRAFKAWTGLRIHEYRQEIDAAMMLSRSPQAGAASNTGSN